MSPQPTLRILAIALAASLFAWGCSSDDDCDNDFFCDTTQPTSGTLSVKVTIDSENPRVPIAVYRGPIEDSALYFRDTLSDGARNYDVGFTRYSASAIYQKGNDRIIAIDGDEVSYDTEDNCGTTCYDVKNGTLKLDLR